MSRRVTVVGSTRRLDATLPDSVPVAELLSDVVEMLGESENGVALEWRLVRVGGQALDLELTLAEQDVVEGTMLFLRDRSSVPPPPLLDDFAGRVAVAVDAQRGRWTGAMAPAVLAWLGGAGLAAAGFAVLATGDARAQTWIGVSGSVLSAAFAFMQRRAARRPVPAVAVAFAGLPAWAAVGAGIAGLAGASATGILAAGMAGTAVGSLVAIAVVG
ncbi:MAG TPA: EsaB/YukD family protein, partial [bacterium]|nr:EsaB/YukD family protein [bacterium]